MDFRGWLDTLFILLALAWLCCQLGYSAEPQGNTCLMKLTFCYLHIAPYHRAQLAALGRSGISVSVIHYGDFREMAFRNEFLSQHYFEEILISEPEGEWSKLYRSIEKTMPDAVLVPGWGHAYALAALRWTVRNQVPCIVISDSQEYDRPRRRVVEIVKRKVVGLFSAAFVAGQKSREYVIKLGMPSENIMPGCDVVDNDHFLQGALAAVENEDAVRDTLRLPQHYFLAVNRLIPEKNVASIIRAYATYCAKGAPGNWDLVILGDGPLHDELNELAADLRIKDRVLFKGTHLYHEMPSFYGLASAFILASFQEPWGLVVNEAMCAGIPALVSELCGSSEIVTDGENGFRFDPYDIEGLAELMIQVASGRWDIFVMGQKSRAIIAEWSLERYLTNLRAVVDIARSVPLPNMNIFDSILLNSAIKWLSKRQ
jgi:glycosyltransferase involved in cell wall biosynthesis